VSITIEDPIFSLDLKYNQFLRLAKKSSIFIVDMASNASAAAFQARRQALINLALKKDPVLIRQKTTVSFAANTPPRSATSNELPSNDAPVNELPPFDTHVNVVSPPQVIVDELPPLSPMIKSTSARSLSIMSPIS
jgi:hypothetical protein